MEVQTVIIIALLVFGFYWYNNPEQGTDIIDSGIDKAKSLVNIKTGQECSDELNEVCGLDGITYKNVCFAQQAGQLNVSMGAC